MDKHGSLITGLCLPLAEIDALLRGRTVAILSSVFITRGRSFALCPLPDENLRQHKQPYRQNFKLSDYTLEILGIAICESCTIIDDLNLVERASAVTIWSTEFLNHLISVRGNIFLACCRVFQLATPHLRPENLTDPKLLSKFVRIDPPIQTHDAYPVLPDSVFTQRSQQLSKLTPPLHPELETLQVHLSETAASSSLNYDLQTFLGWKPSQEHLKNLNWIPQISGLGNSSDGHAFERIVRRSLLSLGFENSNQNSKASLNPEATGGAGGLDFYCETPYKVIGECKSSGHKNTPTQVCSQLTYLGQKYLQEDYDRAIKIVFATGSLTKDAEQIAVNSKMNILRPETLERLVKLNSVYPGSIDLLKLERCLRADPFGESSDNKVNEFIDSVFTSIQVRAYVIQALKRYLANTNAQSVGIQALHGAYSMASPPCPLNPQELHEITIELASPLIGYLGRKGSDEFYWIRDLVVEEI